jgi:hypothetical protein
MLPRVLWAYARLLATLFEAQMTLKRLRTLRLGKQCQRRTTSASGMSETCGDDAGSGGTAGVSEAGGDAERRADARSASGREVSADEVQPTRAGASAQTLAALERLWCMNRGNANEINTLRFSE